jgi:3-deoxy-D-manno-octulosonate 8-phosphate phosphatase (KDO 8-P phosphatase)
LAGVSRISPALKKRAARIKLLLMDVDGTMTDGSVTLLSQTDGTAIEIKTFDAHDGQGLTLAQTAGLRTGCITGRESAALLRRAREMKMEFIYMKQPVKMPAYEEILQKAGVSDSAVAYIGDDLPDIPLMHRAGLAVAVGDAVPEVKDAAHYTTESTTVNKAGGYPSMPRSSVLPLTTTRIRRNQDAAHGSSDGIGMMHTNGSDYFRTRRAQVAVNYSNSLDF